MTEPSTQMLTQELKASLDNPTERDGREREEGVGWDGGRARESDRESSERG